jgi:hypothetical protein
MVELSKFALNYRCSEWNPEVKNITRLQRLGTFGEVGGATNVADYHAGTNAAAST